MCRSIWPRGRFISSKSERRDQFHNCLEPPTQTQRVTKATELTAQLPQENVFVLLRKALAAMGKLRTRSANQGMVGATTKLGQKYKGRKMEDIFKGTHEKLRDAHRHRGREHCELPSAPGNASYPVPHFPIFLPPFFCLNPPFACLNSFVVVFCPDAVRNLTNEAARAQSRQGTTVDLNVLLCSDP